MIGQAVLLPAGARLNAVQTVTLEFRFQPTCPLVHLVGLIVISTHAPLAGRDLLASIEAICRK